MVKYMLKGKLWYKKTSQLKIPNTHTKQNPIHMDTNLIAITFIFCVSFDIFSSQLLALKCCNFLQQKIQHLNIDAWNKSYIYNSLTVYKP